MNNRIKTKEYAQRINDLERIGMYIIQNNATIRKAASYEGISKSTLHLHIHKILSKENPKLYAEVVKVIEKNKAERHERGGLATKKKYAFKRQNKNNRD